MNSHQHIQKMSGKYNYKDITKEDIEAAFRSFEKENPKPSHSPKVTHYEWEENGEKFSSWKIDTGSNVLNCNDAGMKMFEKALTESLTKKLRESE